VPAWSVNQASQKIQTKEHVNMPVSAADATIEQANLTRWIVEEIINSKVVGAGGVYTLALSGTANPGHPAGDSITITVTAG